MDIYKCKKGTSKGSFFLFISEITYNIYNLILGTVIYEILKNTIIVKFMISFSY